MLWLLCISFFAVTSSFPVNSIQKENEFPNYQVQVVGYKELPYQRHSICFPSPFLRQICLPSALQFFIPLQTLVTEQQRCLTIPIMRTYIIKVCPPISQKENLNKSFKEITKEAVTEKETERLPDNTNIEVNGGEVKSEDFVRKESDESQIEDKNTKNNIIRDLETNDVAVNESHERLLTDNIFEDENISITSNLV